MGWTWTNREHYDKDHPNLALRNPRNSEMSEINSNVDEYKKKNQIDPITQSNIRDPWSFEPKIRRGKW